MPIIGAFIVPHPPLAVHEVGRGQEKLIPDTLKAYHEVARRIRDLSPDTIVITSPHSIMYSNYIHISPGRNASGSFSEFGAPEVRFDIDYDEPFTKELEQHCKEEGMACGTQGERKKTLDHGTMLPLHFILQEYEQFKLVRIGISGLNRVVHYHLGKLIAKTADELNRKVVFVASGDLSHKLKEDGPYGYSPDGPVFDKAITKAMEEADFLSFLTMDEEMCDGAAECGHRSFLILAGALDGWKVEPELLSYEGPFGVGYAVASFKPVEKDSSRRFDIVYEAMEKKKFIAIRENEDPLVKLARESLEFHIKTGRTLKHPPGLPEEIQQNKAGVFVSIKKDGSLRGCIGTTGPTTESIADEIIQNAVSAGTRDPRFPEVDASELVRLVYSVDVLFPPEPISGIDELDPKRYGVIVRHGMRSGLLLPNLEGIDTASEQVRIALRKAGIREDESYTMQRFEVIRHH